MHPFYGRPDGHPPRTTPKTQFIYIYWPNKCPLIPHVIEPKHAVLYVYICHPNWPRHTAKPTLSLSNIDFACNINATSQPLPSRTTWGIYTTYTICCMESRDMARWINAAITNAVAAAARPESRLYAARHNAGIQVYTVGNGHAKSTWRAHHVVCGAQVFWWCAGCAEIAARGIKHQRGCVRCSFGLKCGLCWRTRARDRLIDRGLCWYYDRSRAANFAHG